LRPLELWASPEPSFARIDETTVRDQLAETGHAARPDDAELIAALGVSGSRVPVLWERVAPSDPHERDYREPQRRLEGLRAHGIDPILTLLHHGSGPAYTDLLDPAFPLWFAEYAGATAEQFPWVKRWTPINEPLTTARFATLYGVWFPNVSDDRAFGRAMINQTLAQQAAMRRIRRVIPDAEFVLTEDLQRFVAGDDGVAEYVAFLRERMYLSAELVAGRVGEEHRLAPFLIDRCGVNPFELAVLQRDACAPDLMAFDHYPHSERYLFTHDGAPADVAAVYVADQPPPAAGPLLRAAAQRLQLPLALGEITCTRRRPNACAGSCSTSTTCRPCEPRASMCARPARGPRSEWSIGTRSCARGPASPKTASIRSPEPPGRRNRPRCAMLCGRWRAATALPTTACVAGGNAPTGSARLPNC
jgi:dTDP-4-dehydrorhamnose reductase